MDSNHRSAGYEPAGIAGYPIPLVDTLFETFPAVIAAAVVEWVGGYRCRWCGADVVSIEKGGREPVWTLVLERSAVVLQGEFACGMGDPLSDGAVREGFGVEISGFAKYDDVGVCFVSRLRRARKAVTQLLKFSYYRDQESNS